MTLQRHSLTVEKLGEASTPDQVIRIFDKALGEIGAEYHAILLFPLPDEQIDDGVISWKAPSEWRAFYSERNLIHRDPAVRQCRRSVMPFDWASSTYDPRTECRWGEVMAWARDFNVHKGIMVPIPSPTGVVGLVWGAGRYFEGRRRYMAYLHVLGMNAFHRLQQLGAAVKRTERLTERERDILKWISRGKSAWQIGCFLHIQPRIVEWHIEQACEKLGVADKFEARMKVSSPRPELR